MNLSEHIRDLLNRSCSEIEYRTVVSRAYYGAYRESTTFAIVLGFKPLNNGRDHRRLVDYLGLSSNQDCREIIAPRLARMHSNRKFADYTFARTFDKSMADDAFHTLGEILRSIAAVR